MPPHDPQRTPNRTPNRTSETDSHERTNERTDGDTGDGRKSGHGSRRTGAYPDSQSITLAELLADDGKPRRMPTQAEAEVMARLLRDRNLVSDGMGEGYQSLSLVVDLWLDDIEANCGKRWPVIRTGERDTIPWIIRLSVLLRDDFRCRRCPQVGSLADRDHLEIDHCIPWSAGGPDDSDNLRTLCRPLLDALDEQPLLRRQGWSSARRSLRTQGGRMSYHSEAVAYYLAQAREAIRQASAEHHKREVPASPETDAGVAPGAVDPRADGVATAAPASPDRTATTTPTRVQPVRAAIAARKEEQ